MPSSLGSIFKALDIRAENGLAIDQDQYMTTYQKQFFLHAKEKLNIDAVYFLRDSDGTPKTPLIYFSAMDTYDSEKIAFFLEKVLDDGARTNGREKMFSFDNNLIFNFTLQKRSIS